MENNSGSDPQGVELLAFGDKAHLALVLRGRIQPAQSLLRVWNDASDTFSLNNGYGIFVSVDLLAGYSEGGVVFVCGVCLFVVFFLFCVLFSFWFCCGFDVVWLVGWFFLLRNSVCNEGGCGILYVLSPADSVLHTVLAL